MTNDTNFELENLRFAIFNYCYVVKVKSNLLPILADDKILLLWSLVRLAIS